MYPYAVVHLNVLHSKNRSRRHRYPEGNLRASDEKTTLAEWKQEFSSWPEIAALRLTEEKSVNKRSAAQALASAKRVEKKPGDADLQKEEPWKGIPPVYEAFGEEWDFTRRVLNDLSHAVMNTVKNVLTLVSNDKDGKMHWKPKRATLEHAKGRFEEVKTGGRGNK